MKFYQKRGFALVVLVLAILGSCVYGISKKPADLPQVSYGNWLRDDADLLTDETEASLRQYDQSWDSNYRAIIAVATLDTLNGWTYEKAAAELGSRWGLGGNDMLLLLVKDSDYYVALGDNVLDAMTDTYQAGLQGAVEAPYYQGDYDAAALAFFRQADVFYAQTLGRQQSGGSYSDYEDNGAWQGNDSGSVAAVVLLVVGIFVVWILLDGLRYRRYRRRPVVVGGPVYYPVFWGRHPRPPRRPAPPRGPRPPMGGGPRPPMGGGPRPPMGGGSSARQSSSQYPSTLPAFRFPALRELRRREPQRRLQRQGLRRELPFRRRQPWRRLQRERLRRRQEIS